MPSPRVPVLSRSRQPLLTLGTTRNLVVVRAGHASLHPGWLSAQGSAKFDLLVVRYEPGPAIPALQGVAEITITGSKVAGYAALFRQYPELLDRYDFIALFDDDLRIRQRDIEQLFRFGDAYGLDLFQPSLTWDSHFSYAAFLRNPDFLLRYTNMVEMMCPIFRASHLRRALPLFQLSFETGIDLIWCRLTAASQFRYAIIDDVSVIHTRPVGSTKHRQGFDADETYDSQIKAVLDRFDVSFRGVVTYAAVTATGRRIGSRSVIAMRSLRLWRAWKATPIPKRHFVRFLTDYLRHCLFRPLNATKVDLPKDVSPAFQGSIFLEARK